MVGRLCVICTSLCLMGYAAETESPKGVLSRTLPGLYCAFKKPNYSSLRGELLEMQAEDQRVRQIAISERNWNMLQEIDQKHAPRLKEIIEEFGWPGISLVGLEGAEAMWLLVQHQDLDFQKQCLLLVKEAVDKQEAPFRNYAYLMDRVCMYGNEPQVYGTQWVEAAGELVMYPVRDPELLAQRRVEAGLIPIEEYGKQLLNLFMEKER